MRVRFADVLLGHRHTRVDSAGRVRYEQFRAAFPYYIRLTRCHVAAAGPISFVLPSPFVSPHYDTAVTPTSLKVAVSYPLENFLDLLNSDEYSPGRLSQGQAQFVSL